MNSKEVISSIASLLLHATSDFRIGGIWKKKCFLTQKKELFLGTAMHGKAALRGAWQRYTLARSLYRDNGTCCNLFVARLEI